MRKTEKMSMNEVILLKYGEIVLKGLNRNYFNQLLEKNVRRALKRAPGEYELVYAQSSVASPLSGMVEILYLKESMQPHGLGCSGMMVPPILQTWRLRHREVKQQVPSPQH